MLVWRGQYERRLATLAHNNAIDVSVTDKQGALPVDVVNYPSLPPVSWPDCRLFQGLHDTGDPGQDQVDLRFERAPRLVATLVISRHDRPLLTFDWGR
jgi:hypothetical protein